MRAAAGGCAVRCQAKMKCGTPGGRPFAQFADFGFG
jgi:hypothetical protein